MSTVSEQLTELINQKKALATNINEKGVTASESEKFNTLVPKVAQIEELRGEERTLDVLTKYNDIPESIVQLEYPESFNLTSNYKTTTHNGVTFTVNDDMSITVNGTNTSASSSAYILCAGHLLLEANNSYAWNLDIPDNENVGYTLGKVQSNIPAVGTYTPTKEITDSYLILAVPAGKTVNNVTVRQPIFYKRNNIDLQLSSKNLIPYPYANEGTYFTNGITFVVDSDGNITANGTATAQCMFNLYRNESTPYKFPVKSNQIYTVSGMPTGSSASTYFIRFTTYLDSHTNDFYTGAFSHKLNLTSDDYIKWAFIIIQSGQTVENLVFKPQLELGSTATTYTPYISDFSSVNVTACGKNIFNINNRTEAIYNGNSQTLKRKLTGSQYFIGITGNNYWGEGNIKEWAIVDSIVTVLNSYKSSTGYGIGFDIKVKPNTTYFVTHNSNDNGAISIGTYTSDGTWKRFIPSASKFTTQEDENWIVLVCVQKDVDTAINTSTISNIQLEISDTSTTYEPYQEQTYTPTSDGIVTGIQNIYPTTNIFTDNAGVLITVKGGAYKEILPSTGKNGITKVYQEVLNADMIENLKPENIKKGITILGVTGTCASENFVLGTSTLS